MPSHWAPNFAIIAFMVVMSAIVFAWLYSAYFAPTEAQSTPTEIVATVTPVDNERLIVPTNTPKPPTATPMPTETPVPPTPEATATAAATEQAVQPTVDQAADDQTTDEANTPDDQARAEDVEINPNGGPPSLSEGEASIKITAQDIDVQLTVVVDGETVWDGWVGAGNSIGWFTGQNFTVTTSNGLHTQFENHLGELFWMDYTDGPTTYYL